MIPDLPAQFYTFIAVLIVFVIILLVVPPFITGSLGLGTKGRYRRLKAAFVDAAERLGLRYYRQHGVESQLRSVGNSEPGLKGEYRGHQVEMCCHVEIQNSMQHDIEKFSSYTDIKIDFRNELWREGVKIEPRTMAVKLEKKIVGNLVQLDDVKDILTGDRRFDDEFLISGLVGEEMKTALTKPKLKEALLQVASSVRFFQVKLGQLIVEIANTPDTADELIHALDRAVDAAEMLDDALAGQSVLESEAAQWFPDC